MAWAVPLITAGLPWLLNKMSPGKQEEFGQQQTYGPEQMQMYQKMMSQMGGPMNQGFDYLNQQMQGYAPGESPMEKMAQQNFSQKTAPGIAETYAGAGAGSSGGFGQQMGAAGKDLDVQMAGMRQDQQSNAFKQMMQMLGMSMGQQPYANLHRPQEMGAGSAAAPGLMQMGTAAIPELIKQYYAGKGNQAQIAPGFYGQENTKYNMYTDKYEPLR